MSTTITEIDQIDWLNHIDGFTVGAAIAYFLTLNPESVLRASIVHKASGGITLASELENLRELTAEEANLREINRLKNLRFLYQSTVDTHNRWVTATGFEPEGVKPHIASAKLKLAEIDDQLKALQ